VESEFGDGRTPSLCRRLLDGETMTDLCRDFGISRKTGYKIFDRYKEHGLEALSDRSRRPVRYANQLPSQIEGLIVRLKDPKRNPDFSGFFAKFPRRQTEPFAIRT
jgi:hypothetical protein